MKQRAGAVPYQPKEVKGGHGGGLLTACASQYRDVRCLQQETAGEEGGGEPRLALGSVFPGLPRLKAGERFMTWNGQPFAGMVKP